MFKKSLFSLLCAAALFFCSDSFAVLSTQSSIVKTQGKLFTPKKALFKQNQFIIKLKNKPSSSELTSWPSTFSRRLPRALKSVRVLGLDSLISPNVIAADPTFTADLSRIFRIRLQMKASEYYRTLEQLQIHPDIEYAEPDFYVKALDVPVEERRHHARPNDLSFRWQYSLSNRGVPGADIHALPAWDIAWRKIYVKRRHALVAVIDSGVSSDHYDLRNKVSSEGWNFTENSPDNSDNQDPHDTSDPLGHGTHVAGIIAAEGNNGLGIIGVHPTARILPIRFMNGWGIGTTSSAVQAIAYAISKHVNVINASWGGLGKSQALEETIGAAGRAGILFVAAAGNSGENNEEPGQSLYPASYDKENIISVAASDAADKLAYFSNYGNRSVDLAAPGDHIFSTVGSTICPFCDPTGYAYLSGTSMATPHVTASVALLEDYFPNMHHLKVKNKIINSVDPKGFHVKSGGRLNLANALLRDEIIPGKIDGLIAEQSSSTSITLTFTASGDNGYFGKNNRYDIRIGTRNITKNNYDGLPRPELSNRTNLQPKESGEEETITFDKGLRHGWYKFAVRSYDRAGNASPISNIETIWIE